MIITIFIDGLSGGGSERFSTLLSSGLSSIGHEVILLTGPRRQNEYDMPKNVQRVELYKKKSYLRNAFWLNRFNKKNKVDICIAVGIYANLVVALSSLASSTKIILSERNDPRHDIISWKSKLLKKLLFGMGDAYVFQTSESRSYYNKRIQSRSTIIPNPVKEGIPHRSNIIKEEIVAVGRLMPQKNYELLLKAFAIVNKKHPQYRLRIFGTGREEWYLKKLVLELGIKENVVFEGFVLDVHKRISHSDIYVLSSDYEGMPNSLLEAMVMGFPVVSTDCDGGAPKYLIKNGENGLIVPKGNLNELVYAMLSFIENPQLKEKCAKNAVLVYNKCSMDVVISKWNVLLQQLI